MQQQLYSCNSFIPEIFLIIAVTYLLIWGVIRVFLLPATLLNKQLIFLLIEVFIIVFFLFWLNRNCAKVLFNNMLLLNAFNNNIKLVLIGLTLIFLLFCYFYISITELPDFEFLILISFSIFAMLVLLSSNDFITVYISIEMQSLCFYILASLKQKSRLSVESGLKYFILNACSSSLLLFGISLIYGFSGSTNFEDILKLLSIVDSFSLSNGMLFGFLFLLLSFLFKLTIVPFHVWSPDVYEGAPLLVTVFFSTLPKFSIFLIFVKLLFHVFFNLFWVWQPLLTVAASLTVFFSTFAVLYQKKIKRFLAYSSINHAGYLLMALTTGTQVGLHAFLLYLLLYIVTIYSFFGLLLSFKTCSAKRLVYLTDFLHLHNAHFLLRFFFILLLFSLAGIPPLLGFFTKFYVLFSLVDATYYLLSFISIFSSTLGAFYYMRIIKIFNFEVAFKNIKIFFSNKDFLMFFLIFCLFLLVLLSFFVPNFIFLQLYILSMFF